MPFECACLAATLAEKLEAQRQIKDLESNRKRKRAELYDEQDKVDERRNGLIGEIEKQLAMTPNVDPIFAIRWRIM